MEFNRYLGHYDDDRIMIVMMIFTMIRMITMIKMMITMMITMVRFRSMEDLGGKQEKTAGWELVRLLRFDHHYEDEDRDHDNDHDYDHDGKSGDEGNDNADEVGCFADNC